VKVLTYYIPLPEGVQDDWYS